jgi:hypothetical protein
MSDPTPDVVQQYVRGAQRQFATHLSLFLELLGRSASPTVENAIGATRECLGSSIYTENSWANLEVPRLLSSILGCSPAENIRKSKLTLAAFSLTGTFCNLPTERSVIQLRQNAIREIDDNQAMQQALGRFFGSLDSAGLLSILRPLQWSDNIYDYYNVRREAVRTITQSIDRLPSSSDPLIAELLEQVRSLRATDFGKKMLSGVTYTRDGVKATCDVPPRSHGFRFWPYPIDPTISLAWAATAGASLSAVLVGSEISQETINYGVGALFGAATALGAQAAKYSMDRIFVVQPLSPQASRELVGFFHAIANLHELYLLSEFGRNAKVPTSFPAIVDADGYMFAAEKMGSPLHFSDARFVLNNADVATVPVTTLRGPNSGGKSTFTRSILNNSALGQAGARCFAQTCTIAPANRLVYTVPTQSTSGDSEGRYGTELAPLAEQLVDDLGPKTIIGIDEIGSGTSERAAVPAAVAIIETFVYCGAKVVLSTHNDGLVPALQNAQVPIKELHPEGVIHDDPITGERTVQLTHRIKEGPLPADMDPALYVRSVEKRVGVGAAELAEFRDRWQRVNGKRS